jgi:hypothetical protein
MAVSGGWVGNLYSDYRNIPQDNIAIFDTPISVMPSRRAQLSA